MLSVDVDAKRRTADNITIAVAVWLLIGEEELRGKYRYGNSHHQASSIQKSSNLSREHHMVKRQTRNQILTKIFESLKITRISEI